MNPRPRRLTQRADAVLERRVRRELPGRARRRDPSSDDVEHEIGPEAVAGVMESNVPHLVGDHECRVEEPVQGLNLPKPAVDKLYRRNAERFFDDPWDTAESRGWRAEACQPASTQAGDSSHF